MHRWQAFYSFFLGNSFIKWFFSGIYQEQFYDKRLTGENKAGDVMATWETQIPMAFAIVSL